MGIRQIRGWWFQLGIFSPKFKDFCFCTKLCYKKNSRILITKRTIAFRNCSPKYPNKTFSISHLSILIFAKYDNGILKFYPQNTQARHFWSQIQAVSFFHKILQLDKFEGADLKYDNSFLEILALKYGNKSFFVPNLDIFIFSRNFGLANLKVLISNMTIAFFKILTPKHPNKTFLVTNFGIFIFFTKFCN